MKKRNIEIDLTKGMFVLGMIFSHSLGLVGPKPGDLLAETVRILNLTTFSGFVFCFGYAYWLAYLQKEAFPWRRVLVTAAKCYMVFVISAAGYEILVASSKVSINLIGSIMLLRVIPRYSEFLVAFTLFTLLAAIFQKFTRAATASALRLVGVSVVCLAFTFLPGQVHFDPYLGLFIGGLGFNYYPVVQYLPVFLFGIYVARQDIQFRPRFYILVSSGGILLYFLLSRLGFGLVRFPPSLGWIVCSVGFLLLYRGMAALIHAYFPPILQKYFNAVGVNAMFYMLTSNLILFVGSALGLKGELNIYAMFGYFFFTLGLIWLAQVISTDLTHTNQSIESSSTP